MEKIPEGGGTPFPFQCSLSSHGPLGQGHNVQSLSVESGTKLFPGFAPLAGQTGGEAEGNIPPHAGAAAAGREVSQAHRVRAGEREAQAH